MRNGMLLLLLFIALTGCAGAGTRGADASELAVEFEQALVAGRVHVACKLFAPETRSELEESAQKECPAALSEEALPDGGTVQRAEVYGRQAMIILQRDTLFLSQFPAGWRVVAAGCVPESDRPYQCTVKGA
jgi:hypothetical protein